MEASWISDALVQQEAIHCYNWKQFFFFVSAPQEFWPTVIHGVARLSFLFFLASTLELEIQTTALNMSL